MAAQLDNSDSSTSITRSSAAQHYQQLAEFKKQQGQLKEAIEHYRQAIELSNGSAPQPLVKQENKIEKTSFSPTPVITTPKAVQVYLEQAEAFYEQGHCSQAIQACQAALAIVPELAEAYKLWGNALQKQGQPLEAMGYYAKVLELEPNSAVARVNLGNLYAQKQKWQEALYYYQEALELDPNFILAHRNLAKVWTKLGHPEEALKCRYQEVNLEPEKVSAQEHLHLGEQLWQLGWTMEAIVCYRRTVRMAPELSGGYQRLGDALIRCGEWQEGVQYLQRGQELTSQKTFQGKVPSPTTLSPTPQPPSLPANTKKSSIPTVEQVAKDLNEQGMVAKYRGIILNPESGEIQADLGSVYAQKQDWNKAIACYKKALAVAPNLVQIHRNLAKALSQAGKEAEAADSWYQVLKLEPKALDAKQCLSLGNTLVKQGKVQKATVFWQQAIKLQPDLVEAYHCLGEALAKQGDRDKAIAVYQQGLKSNSFDVVSWRRLVAIYQEKENWEKTIECYQQLVKLEPDSAQIHNDFGKLLLQLDQLEEAEKLLRRAIELNKSKVRSNNSEVRS